MLAKCAHFLNSKFVEIRLVTLDTIQQGVEVLVAEQDRLLPMVHKLWPPMVQCFSDEELVSC